MNMKPLEVLVKSLILVIHDYKVNEKITVKGTVKTILEDIDEKTDGISFREDRDIVNKLRFFLNNIMEGDIIPNEEILVSIEIILIDKLEIIKLINKYMLKNSEHVVKRLTSELNTYLAKLKVTNLLTTALYDLKKPTTISSSLVKTLRTDLANLITSSSTKSYILDSIDFNDMDSITEAAQKANDLISGGSVLITGWEELNDSIYGGFRRGEFWMFTALPNNYKSSMIKTLFLQLMRFNKPALNDDTKKPMFLFISLEEEINNVMFFFYQYLKLANEDIVVDGKDKRVMDPNVIAKYVYDEFNKYGYNVRVHRVKPIEFDVYAFEDIIDHYESEGYEIINVSVDYVKKMNRRGANSNGPSGTDLLDLFSMMRNITSPKDILLFTPHQSNTKVKELLQNGLEDEELNKFISGKGMYADSKQLDQELDGDFHIHLVKKEDKTYISMQRAKHRLPIPIPEYKKGFVIEFKEPNAPALENSEKNKWSKRDIEDNDSSNTFF